MSCGDTSVTPEGALYPELVRRALAIIDEETATWVRVRGGRPGRVPGPQAIEGAAEAAAREEVATTAHPATGALHGDLA